MELTETQKEEIDKANLDALEISQLIISKTTTRGEGFDFGKAVEITSLLMHTFVKIAEETKEPTAFSMLQEQLDLLTMRVKDNITINTTNRKGNGKMTKQLTIQGEQGTGISGLAVKISGLLQDENISHLIKDDGGTTPILYREIYSKEMAEPKVTINTTNI